MHSWEPHPPELFGAFHRKRTRQQRVRSIVRAIDVARQRALVAASRAARPITSRFRG